MFEDALTLNCSMDVPKQLIEFNFIQSFLVHVFVANIHNLFTPARKP